jgi:Dyp-type peroxidase family
VIPPGPPTEPILDVDDIQGNILVGFNKDHQLLLMLGIVSVPAAKCWLAAIQNHIATTAEVLGFNQLRKAVKARRNQGPSGLAATWVNIAFSHAALIRLTTAAETNGFSDAFRVGLAGRAGLIFDPVNPAEPGHPSHWEFGGTPETTPDVLLIFAGDDPAMLQDVVQRWRAELAGFADDAGQPALREILAAQQGDTLGGALNGHEHFGFKDGISQPGIRGRASADADDFLSPRSLDPTDSRAIRFGKPGQPLVWPGQFVLGLARQDDQSPIGSLPPLDLDPPWAANGSYLVLRKLQQNVPAFWASMRVIAQQFPRHPPPGGVVPLAAHLVGRWPSGTPVMRSFQQDAPAVAEDELLSNDFGFREATPALRLAPGIKPPARFPPAGGDPDGLVCPLAAHIRKVNPRDDPTEQSGSTDTLTRLILRRGIPYGPPLPDPQTSPDDGTPRGLLFISYQASIEAQFEFLMSNWVNQIDRPRTAGGRDAILGRHSIAPPTTVIVPGSDGALAPIPLSQDWIVPVGGGYFFAPSISAIRDRLARQDPPPQLSPGEESLRG